LAARSCSCAFLATRLEGIGQRAPGGAHVDRGGFRQQRIDREQLLQGVGQLVGRIPQRQQATDGVGVAGLAAPALHRHLAPQRGLVGEQRARRQWLAGGERVLAQGALAEAVDGVHGRQVHLRGGGAQALAQRAERFAARHRLAQQRARGRVVGRLALARRQRRFVGRLQQSALRAPAVRATCRAGPWRPLRYR
jgi:hypothetical protein